MTGSVSTSYSIPFLSSFSFLSGHHILLWCCSVQRPPYVYSVTFPLLLNHLFPSTQHRMHWNLIPRHLLLGHTHIDQLTRTLLSPCTKLVVVSPYIYEDNSRISWATQYHPSAPVMCLALCAATIACCCEVAIQMYAVNWQWQNDIAFHTGVLLPSLLFVHVALPLFCCFSCLYHIFFILCSCMFPPPPHPLFFVACFFFFSAAAFVILFVFIFSIVNCHERLA